MAQLPELATVWAQGMGKHFLEGAACFPYCCRSLRKAPVFVAVRAPEQPRLCTAFSVGLLFNGKDSLLS